MDTNSIQKSKETTLYVSPVTLWGVFQTCGTVSQHFLLFVTVLPRLLPRFWDISSRGIRFLTPVVFRRGLNHHQTTIRTSQWAGWYGPKIIAIIQASGLRLLSKTLRDCWSIIIPILLSAVELAMVLSAQYSTGGAKVIVKSGKVFDFFMGKFTKLYHDFGSRSWNKSQAMMTQLKSCALWLLVRRPRPQWVAL